MDWPCQDLTQGSTREQPSISPLHMGLGVGETSFFKTRRFEASFWREMGDDTEFEASFRRKMGNDMNSRQVFGEKRETIRYKIHHFYRKNKKNREKTGKTGEKTLKKKQEKTGKNRKLQEIQKQVFDEVPGNAENRNEFGNEFGKKFGNEFGSKFEVFSNVTKQRFEGKNDTSSRPYMGLCENGFCSLTYYSGKLSASTKAFGQGFLMSYGQTKAF